MSSDTPGPLPPELVALLACPVDASVLAPAPQALLDLLTGEAARRALRNAAGRLVEGPLGQGLVTADGHRLYRVVDGVPVLVVDEAIILTADERAVWLAANALASASAPESPESPK